MSIPGTFVIWEAHILLADVLLKRRACVLLLAKCGYRSFVILSGLSCSMLQWWLMSPLSSFKTTCRIFLLANVRRTPRPLSAVRTERLTITFANYDVPPELSQDLGENAEESAPVYRPRNWPI
ncbi:hypothetical protein RvY_18197-3 [Ramazzottius varieornatus]|uniref:Uncharacterized protein n=1 Tax=Ramazzottius varieornatus TaxID=947166 RepID=A0A1D1W4U7_RAMVA|nr:hypothetical protein RvY_18197-3 [Ramazzottius varieornatus]